MTSRTLSSQMWRQQRCLVLPAVSGLAGHFGTSSYAGNLRVENAVPTFETPSHLIAKRDIPGTGVFTS